MKDNFMNIRKETPKDYDAVYDLVKQAFATAEHSDGAEQDLVIALRGSSAFIPELSLVAELNGEIVGYILFTIAFVNNKKVLALAPLAVKPKYQKKGIGSQLVQEGHRIATNLGYGYSFVLGDNQYYSQFGYILAQNLGVNAPLGIPSEYFMGIKLIETAEPISGDLVYVKEFGI